MERKTISEFACLPVGRDCGLNKRKNQRVIGLWIIKSSEEVGRGSVWKSFPSIGFERFVRIEADGG
jgi:hypothetical protein